VYHAASVAENIHAENHKVVLEEAGQTVPVLHLSLQLNQLKKI